MSREILRKATELTEVAYETLGECETSSGIDEFAFKVKEGTYARVVVPIGGGLYNFSKTDKEAADRLRDNLWTGFGVVVFYSFADSIPGMPDELDWNHFGIRMYEGKDQKVVSDPLLFSRREIGVIVNSLEKGEGFGLTTRVDFSDMERRIDLLGDEQCEMLVRRISQSSA